MSLAYYQYTQLDGLYEIAPGTFAKMVRVKIIYKIQVLNLCRLYYIK